MHLLLTILLPLAASVLLLLIPGALLLAATKLERCVPAALLPAAAFVASLVPLAVVTAVALAVHLPARWITVGQALVALGAWIVLARRERSALYPARALARTRAREIPWGAWLAAAATGIAAMVVGFYAWNDSIYHIAQAQKLLHLAHPTFSNTLQFSDGSAHPGYLLPLWQEVIAQVSLLGRVDPVVTAWVLPALTVSLAALTFGGLVATLTRLPSAVTVGTVAWGLVAVIAPLPLSDAVLNAMHPGSITLTILTPFVLALVFEAVWNVGTVRARPVLILVLPTIVLFAILHVSNLVLLALGMFGYLAIWALRAPWCANLRRHFVVFGCVGLVAVICVGALLPGLTGLESFGKDATGELARNDTDLFEGKNAVDLDALLRGDVEAGSYHLRADYLVLGGGLSVLALFAIAFAPLLRRWPGVSYLIGTTLLVLAIALTDKVFPHFVDVVSLDQARRIEKALPLAPGLAIGALAIAADIVLCWRRGGRAWRSAAVVFAAAGAGLVWWATDAAGPLEGYGGTQIVAPWIIVTAFVILAVLTFVWVVREHQTPGWANASGAVPDGTIVVATALLLVALIPAAPRFTALIDGERIEHLSVSHRVGELRILAKPVVQGLRDLPVGGTALLDPRTREAYAATAVAPIYVVSSSPRHTATTPKNRVPERYRLAVSFYDDSLDDAERLQLLLDERVDAVVVASDSPLRDGLLLDTPGIQLVARGYNQWLYRVDREKLAQTVGKPSSR